MAPLDDLEGEMLQRHYSDGSSDLTVDNDFSIHSQPDGSRIVRHKLFHQSKLLGTVSNTYESASSTRPLGGGRRCVNVPFTDTKGNVTHIYKGENAELCEKLGYDDFGYLESDSPDDPGKDRVSTYEGKRIDEKIGLLDFGSRWYNPLVGRFTTPDDILDMEFLTRPDGLNRYAFENNDPINHIDPTGHMSWSAALGLTIGILLVVAAVVVTVTTGGAAAPLAAMAVGALASGGIGGSIYSLDHADEEDAGNFWGGFATTVVINAAIGAAPGYLGAVATPARGLTGVARIAAKAGSVVAKGAIAGGAAVLSGVTNHAVENAFHGANRDLLGTWKSDLLMGAVSGAVFGALSKP